MEHHQQMELLDQFSIEKQFNRSLKDKLKHYFLKRQSLDRMQNYNKLMNLCSPTLRGEVAKTLTGAWIMKVSWLRNASETFVTSMALLLTSKISPPLEPISSKNLHVIVHGVAIKDMVVKCTGMVWGEDMVLHNQHLRRTSPAVTLTYCETLFLERQKFERLLNRFPVQKKHVRRATIWLAFRRKFLLHAQETELLADQIQALLKNEFGGKDRQSVAEIFLRYDKSRSGVLDVKSFSQCLESMGFHASHEVIKTILQRFDKNENGKIYITKFLDYFLGNNPDDLHTETASRKESDMFKTLAVETNEILHIDTYDTPEQKLRKHSLSSVKSRPRLASVDHDFLSSELAALRNDVSKLFSLMQALLESQRKKS